MKKNYLPGRGRAAWVSNKPFLLFFLSLLAILSILKIIFYRYNLHFIFPDGGETPGWQGKLKMIKWSLLNDSFTLLIINVPLLILLQAGRYLNARISNYLLMPLFILVNALVILLNLMDIFYLPFHFQRANADLLFVLKHPIDQLFHLAFIKVLGIFVSIIFVLVIVWKIHQQFLSAFRSGKHGIMATVVFSFFFILLFVFKSRLSKFLVPTYPLTEINSRELVMVQNSFHSFVYSLFRRGEEITGKNYMPDAECDSLFPIRKLIPLPQGDTAHKNIVLFIMESVPYDFFDPVSPYKVSMPFFDSIVEKSSFFRNAFCYAHESNKGITAILGGVPTLPDIPLYHSSFINMPVTAIGSELRKNNYHSFFCIGDEFDNFGFAKCSRWLGFDDYYSMGDMPGHAQAPMHSMGLQDDFVLSFLEKKITESPAPFFAVHYNISTHYPYDLPAGYSKKFPGNYTAPMKSMSYYDECLQHFFGMAKKEPWFKNTVFLFCSDHWLVPDDKKVDFNSVSGYRIPIIIYDPSNPVKKINNGPVSQFDILGTLISLGGSKDSIISYGSNLLDSTIAGRAVFSRANASLYQVTDSAYILGFNSSNDQVEFLYHYQADPALKKNLVNDPGSYGTRNALTLKIKAFLQKAAMQYRNKKFK